MPPPAVQSSLPPDRGQISTEQRNPHSIDLDLLDSENLIRLMADDHRQVALALENAAESLAAFIDATAEKMRAGDRLIYIGAGTSGRLGVLDASECPPTFQSDPNQVIGIIAGGDSSLRKSSEGKEDDPNGAADALKQIALTENDTVLGIAAGGTTPYVLGALRIAKSSRATTGLLTCSQPMRPVESCDHLIVLDTGPELLTGSTRLKAGSATKLALNCISTGIFVQLGKVYSNLMVDLRATNAKLLDRAIRIVCQLNPDLDRAAAHDLLKRADGQAKLAHLMHRLQLDRSEAELRLKRTEGSLRAALEQT